MIIFEQDKTSYFAIEKDVVIGNKVYEELLYGEISCSDEKFVVVWEDDWQNKVKFATLDDAKRYVVNSYPRHTAHINGRVYDVDQAFVDARAINANEHWFVPFVSEPRLRLKH